MLTFSNISCVCLLNAHQFQHGIYNFAFPCCQQWGLSSSNIHLPLVSDVISFVGSINLRNVNTDPLSFAYTSQNSESQQFKNGMKYTITKLTALTSALLSDVQNTVTIKRIR